MNNIISTLLTRMDSGALAGTDVIPWSCPVPSFGDVDSSRVATLGLNPSNREFVDETGEELDGTARRFHTLKSLGIERWSEAKPRHLRLIGESCRGYFLRNPYDAWFRRLDGIIAGTSASYYSSSAKACHLDLIPFATACKWTGLSRRARAALVACAGDSLGLLLRDSPIQLLVLNGESVVSSFEDIAGVRLQERAVPEWSLPRRSRPAVMGFAYQGSVRKLAKIKLKREVMVLGFNHNIQSSFGVTSHVIAAIRNWIGSATKRLLA